MHFIVAKECDNAGDQHPPSRASEPTGFVCCYPLRAGRVSHRSAVTHRGGLPDCCLNDGAE